MNINGTQFRIPLTYVLPLNMPDGVQMLIGCNFIRSHQGGIRIENNTIVFYKEVTQIPTNTTAEKAIYAIPELEFEDELEYIRIQQDYALYSIGGAIPQSKSLITKILEQLEDLKYIGENPQEHWSKNQVTCKIDIINPDVTIQDKPLKHITPAMKETYKRHVNKLLQLKVIRPSKSRHRTAAIIVYSGTVVDLTQRLGNTSMARNVWYSTTES